ncbi:ketopantoate reductase family protein [Thalassotalea euphylliae]|uniref:ketopantoate reductase family protein n=1 Tax=Thalassotalea euphylliae TaxID=1655234 RepID=UPI003642D5B2
MNIVIVGKGAIASLWAYHLTQSSMITLSWFGSAGLAENDFQEARTFSTHSGNSFRFSMLQTSKNRLASADLLIVCVKAPLAAKAINEIAEFLSPNTDVLLCHNGMGVTESLSAQVRGNCAIYSALTTHGCKRVTPHHVQHTGIGITDIGPRNDTASPDAPHWLHILHQALPTIFWHSDIKEKQWLKLAINCVINPLTAANQVENGALLTPQYAKDISTLAQEVAMIANAEGIVMESENIERIAKQVARDTAKNTSSMLADVLARRKTEIEHINGFLLKLANKHQIKLPMSQDLVNTIKRIEEEYYQQ